MRISPLATQGSKAKEVWSRGSEKFSVDVTLGKRTNLLELKRNVVANLTQQQAHISETRSGLYAQDDLEAVAHCMVCGADVNSSVPRLRVYGASYVQCSVCTHVFIAHRPSEESFARFYADDSSYAATYTDKSGAEKRLNAVYLPWVEWIKDAYLSEYGYVPRSVLDVGSGGGHFVEACRRSGIEAYGVEVSRPSRLFAADCWGIELDPRNFLELAGEYHGVDIVTFWGLIEHVVSPIDFLRVAREIISASQGGMVLAKLPRWESLSSAAQSINPAGVIRHLDPQGHIMCFTDASAAELFHRAGYRPAYAWYYGMDVYEFLMQTANLAGHYDVFLSTGSEQADVQQWVDEARFADSLVLTGCPR